MRQKANWLQNLSRESSTESQKFSSDDAKVTVRIRWTTFATAAVVILFAYSLVLLWPLLKLVILAALFAAALHPEVRYLERKGLATWARSAVIATLIITIALFMSLVVPPVVEQVGLLSYKFPTIRDEILQRMPQNNMFKTYLEHYAETPRGPGIIAWYDQVTSAGTKVLSALWNFGIFLIASIYLLIDGSRLYEWFIVFFNQENQDKIERTVEEGSDLIFAYVTGQCITSFLVFAFTFALLISLGVPGALILAIIAGILDIFPVIGFFLAAIPAVAISLTVSPTIALIVAVSYSGYHILESYVIVPRVYGRRLRLSNFAVLLAVLVGWELAGVVGAVLALPITASYSVIEQIWLAKYLHKRVIRKHEAQRIEQFGEKAEA